MSLTRRIKNTALDLGFDLVGIAPAQRALHADAYAQWVEDGCAAGMGYMARSVPRRQDPRILLEGARSVVVVGLSYYAGEPPASIWSDPSRGRVARYAWGDDYHESMSPALEKLAQYVAQESRQGVRHRVCVDTSPILERDAAAAAGLGFIGRNTCLIHPVMGSHLFLGELLLDITLDYDLPMLGTDDANEVGGNDLVPGCGQCRRCLDACPTGALRSPYLLDSRRCISYLTIENKGEIPVPARSQMGNWIFGCDICQDVCPWPRRYARAMGMKEYDGDPDRIAPRLVDLMALTDAEFEVRFRHTPLWRSKRQGLLRNVAVALGNWGDEAAVAVLERACRDEESMLIREHAGWALGRIRNRNV
jgi:epoxyqueuosine reductase